ncbi:alpha/beta hydrolase family protein [Alicyclobacillus sp. ALC3]|uniref:alpha/beta hydrolase family protein n=1 Tax=Alicyclobacillus sp. ALC3 TaxID=2796143 RepID=UPI0023785A3B|nr:prolyl oligopeptidase family serine peptidase [Alicyclobacillus sp. ALC3]WDL96021.1 prolyl oligopeptidase family serine peptidase [Alicyclobacillus sp. ALC3]
MESPNFETAQTHALPDVTVYPEYRGYADSQGQVQGLLGDTIDTENAIRAADSLKAVNKSMIRLWGYQLGAGVALMVASNPNFAQYTQYIVAMDPFVGWGTLAEWSKENFQSNTLAQNYLGTAVSTYGQFSPSAKPYVQRSPNLKVLQSTPVLLLQGTSDKNMPWQTVQMFYEQLKKAHDPVTLDLIPHGNGKLKGQNQASADAEIQKWLNSLY